MPTIVGQIMETDPGQEVVRSYDRQSAGSAYVMVPSRSGNRGGAPAERSTQAVVAEHVVALDAATTHTVPTQHSDETQAIIRPIQNHLAQLGVDTTRFIV